MGETALPDEWFSPNTWSLETVTNGRLKTGLWVRILPNYRPTPTPPDSDPQKRHKNYPADLATTMS